MIIFSRSCLHLKMLCSFAMAICSSFPYLTLECESYISPFIPTKYSHTHHNAVGIDSTTRHWRFAFSCPHLSKNSSLQRFDRKTVWYYFVVLNYFVAAIPSLSRYGVTIKEEIRTTIPFMDNVFIKPKRFYNHSFH